MNCDKISYTVVYGSAQYLKQDRLKVPPNYDPGCPESLHKVSQR